ncbi:MAG: phosphotransferase family protein [Carbonactinosporaceae bacterium]
MTTTSENHIIDQLGMFGSIPDWLAAPMQPERVIASLLRNVPELSEGRLQLLRCSADRLRAKGTEWLARYSLTVAQPDGEVRDVVLVGNLWGPLAETPAATSVDGMPFGESGWASYLPDLRLTLRAQANDEALPALPTLVDPESAAQLLRPVLHAAGYREAAIAACEPVVVRYKPGSRCTVVVRLSYLDANASKRPPSPIVVKTHQGDKGEVAWAAMNALWQRPHSWLGVVQLAEPLAYLPDDRILVQGPIPEEQTLKELARDAIASMDATMLARLRDGLTNTARGLAAIHGSGASYGRTATFEDELAEVREVLDRLSLSVPGLPQAAAPLLRLLTSRSRLAKADPIVSAHHDFRPAQVLLHGGGVGFIDFDGACMAEPALDLGRFRAKLRDIGIFALDGDAEPCSESSVEENLALLDDLCEHFLAAYQQYAPVSRTRVLIWEACDLLTTMLHAWTKVRLARLEPRLTTLTHQLSVSGLCED